MKRRFGHAGDALRRKGKSISAFQVRITKHGEWHMGAATLTNDGALKQAKRRIQKDALLRIEIGRRPHRQLIRHVMRVILDRNDLQFALLLVRQPAFTIDHLRKFAYRHPMNNGNGELTHPRFEGHIENGPVDIAIGIGPVEDEQLFSGLGAGFHDVTQHIDVGIKTAAYVLDIKDHDIDSVHIGFRRFAFGAVKRDDGDACSGIDLVRDLGAIAGFAAKAMFRSKDLPDVYPKIMKTVDKRAAADDTRWIAQNAYTFAF